MKQFIVSGMCDGEPCQLTIEAQTQEEAENILYRDYALDQVFGINEWE